MWLHTIRCDCCNEVFKYPKPLAYSVAMRLSFSKVFGSRVRVESTGKVAELELAEKVKYFWKICKMVAIYYFKVVSK